MKILLDFLSENFIFIFKHFIKIKNIKNKKNFSAEAKTSSSQTKKNLGNQVIRKGWLSVHNISFVRGSKDCWFVLTSDNLSWYKDDEVN